MSSPPKENKQEGWTKDEKFDLLKGLRAVGPNADKLKNFVNKTEDEIKIAIEFYKNKSMELPPENKQERKLWVPPEPLAEWAKFLLDNNAINEYPAETVAALRQISEMDENPSPLLIHYFKKMYQTFTEAAQEGTPIKTDNNTEEL